MATGLVLVCLVFAEVIRKKKKRKPLQMVELLGSRVCRRQIKFLLRGMKIVIICNHYFNVPQPRDN